VPRSAGASACEACPLAHCPVGLQVTVLCIDCPALDAARLRTLGVYEGARVGIVDTRSGMLLDVRGARLALGWKVVDGIRVLPA
jgi:Fe2+ transport system protein FeoA